MFGQPTRTASSSPKDARFLTRYIDRNQSWKQREKMYKTEREPNLHWAA